MKAFALPMLITSAFFASVFSDVKPVQKTKILVDNSRLTYNVNEDKKLDGAYFVENTNRKVWLRGTYKENTRAGNWYAFNSDGSTFVRYNYDLNKLIALDTVALKKAEISITDKNPDAAKNGSVVLPICSIDQYSSLLGEAAKAQFPKEIVVYNSPIDINIIAKVKSKTDVSYIITYQHKNNWYSYQLKEKDMDFKIDWIPSTYDGKDVEAEFKVATKIVFTNNGTEKQRFVWNY